MCVLVFSVGAINAQVITWTGVSDSNFLNTANWDLGTIPNSTSDVTIAASTNSSIYNMALSTVDSGNSTNYISHLIIQSGGQLTVSAPINITSSGNNYTGGNLKLEDGGSMNFRNALYLGITSNPATVNIDGGTLNSKSFLIISERSDCTMNINGGTVSVDQNSNGRAIIIGNYYAVGIVNLNEGTLKTNPLLNGTAALTIAENGKGDPNASGYLMIDNGTLQMGGDQQTFVQGYVTAGKIKPAAGKQIVVTYDSTAAVTYVTATTPLSINDETSIVSTNVNAIGNKIYVSNVKSTSEINIYSITGALVKSFKTNEDTNFSFKSGLWIATVRTLEGQKSIKLLMK